MRTTAWHQREATVSGQGPSRKVVVVGAGLSGAAAAHELVRLGHRVTLIDGRLPGREHGGLSAPPALFNVADADPANTWLATRSRRMWADLEAASGRTLICSAGVINHGPQRDLMELAHSLRVNGIRFELMNPQDAAQRWPGLAFDSWALWTPSAGVIDTRLATAAMVDLAEAGGATVRYGVSVTGMSRTNGGWSVRTDQGTLLRADQVVVAVGDGMPALLPELGLNSAERAEIGSSGRRQEQTFRFPYRHQAAETPGFLLVHDGIRLVGLPGKSKADHRALRIRADGDISRQQVIDLVRDYVPGVVPEPIAEASCSRVSRQAEDFVIDCVEGMTIVAPCSGDSAAWVPWVGRMVGESITGAAKGVEELSYEAVAG